MAVRHDRAAPPAGTVIQGRPGPRALPSRWRRRAAAALALLAVGAGVSLAAGFFPRRQLTPASPRVWPEVPVTTMDLVNSAGNNSPLLAADPTEERFVVLANRQDGPDFSCSVQLSGDGGRSWLTVNAVPNLPPGAEKCYSPEAAFDAEGRLYYLFVGLAGPGNSPTGVFLTTSTDRGQTFIPPQQVLGPERYSVRMALDRDMGKRGRIHLVWVEARTDPPVGGFAPVPNPIMAAYSDDGGKTFSPPVQVSDPDRARVVGPALALGADHRVHVLYYDLRDDVRDYQGLEGPTWEGNWSLVATTSNDGGRRFEPGVVVDDQLVPPERIMLIFTMPPPALVADGSGHVYAAWHDTRNGDWDVFLRRSPDGGRRWDPPRRLNDDAMGNGRHQYLPRLSLAPNGRLDAVFYDRRASAENRGNDVSYTSTTDGHNIDPNLRLTTQGSDSHIGPQYGVPSAERLFEFGSRIALLSQRSKAVAAWTDTRNTSRSTSAQDIFATQIDVPHRPEPSWAARLAGVALAAGGLAGLAAARRRNRRRAEAPVADGLAEAEG